VGPPFNKEKNNKISMFTFVREVYILSAERNHPDESDDMTILM